MVQRIPIFSQGITIVCHKIVGGGVALVTPVVVHPVVLVNQVVARTLRFCQTALTPRRLPWTRQVSKAKAKRSAASVKKAASPSRRQEVRLAHQSAPQQHHHHMVASQKLVCGGLAGVTSKTITAPVDRIRLLMMTNHQVGNMTGAYETAISHPRGIRALWMGNGINCLKIAPEMALKLFAFDHLTKMLAQGGGADGQPHKCTTTERLLAGAAAGALAESTVYPMDVMRTRMATGHYANLSSCATAVWNTGGARAFFAGLSLSICGIIPYASIDLCVFSTLKDMALARAKQQQSNKNAQVSVPVLMACGMVSSSTSATLTFPLMVIRTQAQATNLAIGPLIRNIWTHTGLRGFYRGLTPSLLTVMPATSITYTAYEWLNAHLNVQK